MIFNVLPYYLLFLAPAVLLFRIASIRLRPWIIVFFGAAFFVYFGYRIAGVAGSACLLIFLWEALISRLYRPGSRWCFMGMALSLVFLGIFKYWNFFTGLLLGHSNPLYWQGAFLPLGISFFTFEFYHFASDRHTGKAESGTFIEYLAFILFFPTMVAGPIKRFQEFVPQLRTIAEGGNQDLERGITRILVGLAKKFGVADMLAAFTLHLNAHDILVADRRILPIWLLAYGIKIYADFSGYSDIAIGSARLFGLRVQENFDFPYGRRNIQRFWRCWHMSLTRWLRDYIYIPMGGSRVPVPRIYMNVLVVMVLCGLWHGAGLNFLVWGLWHGLLLVGHRAWRQLRGEPSNHPAAVFGSRVLTFALVNAGWAFFCMDIPTAMLFYRRLIFPA